MKQRFFEKENLSMVIWVPLTVLFIALAPAFLNFSPVRISKEPATIEKKVFDKKDPPKEAGLEESKTVYEFVCDSNVDYDVQEETKISNENWQVRLKVTKARVTLKLPITVWLSQNIPNRRSDYEDGHVKICTRVFVDAQVPANAACRSVLGRSFFGEGKDLNSAKEHAVEIAKQEITERYVEAVTNKVKDVFVIYDFYAPTWRRSAEILVDKALQDYELGKPRKLSRL